jgi:hypothetical protein
MANEYTLSYTASEIDEKLGKIDSFITAEDASEAVANDIELPQDWVDINAAYEAFGEPGHKLRGGLLYKDFEGNIKVYPLSPAYGVRTEECGKKLDSVVVYNTAQQIMAKPATDGRHTVCLRQLDEFFGGGKTSDLDKGEKAFSLQKIPPVDLTPDINHRKPYVFCRDSENKFAPKYYTEGPTNDTLAERDQAGRLRCAAPDAYSTVWNDHIVNVDYLNRRLSDFQPSQPGVDAAQVKSIMENILLEGKW